jgi:hypothetical protein
MAGEFSCFLEQPVEAENSQPTSQSLTDNYRNKNCRTVLVYGVLGGATGTYGACTIALDD